MNQLKNSVRVFIAAGLVMAAAAAVHADAPATQPVGSPADSPDVKAIRDQLLKWDKEAADMSLEDMRKTYHTENDREAKYLDFVAHETWEACKTEKAVREKWGADADAKFSHSIGMSTFEDDQKADIKIDGDHATVTWSYKESTPLSMIKVDGHWLNDAHAMFEAGLKEDPNIESEKHSQAKLMKQARDDISAGKFDDADAFIADFKTKLEAGGN
jgi:hypothetical protein